MRTARNPNTARPACCKAVVLALLVLLTVRGSAQDPPVKAARIAVLSRHGYQEAMNKWTPTAAYLTQEIPGWSFTVVPLESGAFESALDYGTVDFAICCPSLYVKVKELYGATRIVTMKTRYSLGSYHVFGAVVFCRSANKTLQDFADLKGRRVIALHDESCTVWHVARITFQRHGIHPTRDFARLTFGGSPREVVHVVRCDGADVGIIRTDMFDSLEIIGDILPGEFHILTEDADEHEEVEFAHSTGLYPERAFAQLRGTSDELAKETAIALMSMVPQDVAAEATRCDGWTIPHNYESLRDGLKMLRIVPYETYGKVTLAHIFVQYGVWIASIAVLVAIVIGALALILIQGRRLHLIKRTVLVEQIVEVSDRTQQELGEMIHGTLGQQLTSIRLFAETLKEQDADCDHHCSESIQQICEAARSAVHQSQDIARSLYPVALQRGLRAAFEEYLSAIGSTFGLRYTLRVTDDLAAARSSGSLHLYRIMQEAVHNAIKHGRAARVHVEIDKDGNAYRMVVEDDGSGFSPTEACSEGLGLHIMRYRAAAVGGTLSVAKQRDAGTRVTCTFDLAQMGKPPGNSRWKPPVDTEG